MQNGFAKPVGCKHFTGEMVVLQDGVGSVVERVGPDLRQARLRTLRMPC